MLDGGPARVVRPTERQTAYRQEAARAPQEPSVSVRHTLQPEEPVAKPPRKAKSKSPRGAIIGLIIALILVLGAGGYLAFQAFGPGIARSIDKSKYQAVFFLFDRKRVLVLTPSMPSMYLSASSVVNAGGCSTRLKAIPNLSSAS